MPIGSEFRHGTECLLPVGLVRSWQTFYRTCEAVVALSMVHKIMGTLRESGGRFEIAPSSFDGCHDLRGCRGIEKKC